MKMVKADIGILRDGTYKHTKHQMLLDEFLAAGVDCAEIVPEEGEYSSVYSMSATVQSAIRRYRYTDVVAKAINGRVYLYRKDRVER